MNINEIKELAKLEQSVYIQLFIDEILSLSNKFPKGKEYTFNNSAVVDDVVRICDERKIPVFQFSENCISTAKTYSNLLDFESDR